MRRTRCTRSPASSATGPSSTRPDTRESRRRVRARRMHEIVPTEQPVRGPPAAHDLSDGRAGRRPRPLPAVRRRALRRRGPSRSSSGGQGGDEIFGGYARYLVAYLEQAIKGAIFESTEEAEHIVSLKSIVPNLPALRQYAPMLQHFWQHDVFEPMDRRYFRLIDRSGGSLRSLQRRLPRRTTSARRCSHDSRASSITRTRSRTTTR